MSVCLYSFDYMTSGESYGKGESSCREAYRLTIQSFGLPCTGAPSCKRNIQKQRVPGLRCIRLYLDIVTLFWCAADGAMSRVMISGGKRNYFSILRVFKKWLQCTHARMYAFN